jgi:O-acetyl-ADP-ribose deacetylase (regulator of RNase III)
MDAQITPMQKSFSQFNTVAQPHQDVHQATQTQLDNPTKAATGAITTGVAGDQPHTGTEQPDETVTHAPSMLQQTRSLFQKQQAAKLAGD